MYIGVFSVGPSFNIHDFSSMKQNVPDIRTKVPSDRTMHRCALAPGEPFHCSCCTRQISRLPKSSKKTPMELAKNSLLDISRSDCEAQKAVTKPQMLPSRTAVTQVIANWGSIANLRPCPVKVHLCPAGQTTCSGSPSKRGAEDAPAKTTAKRGNDNILL